MSETRSKFFGGRTPFRTRERGDSRVIVLGLVCLAAGFGSGVLWHYRAAQSPKTESGSPVIHLSEGTKAILRQLEGPVEIRFYALLGERGGDAALRAFAGRADRLLTAFEQAADGKLEVKRHTNSASAELTAAATDGITAFNRDKGEAQYLGVTIARNEQKETLGRLSPEWEQALESDLSRALQRVVSAQAAVAAALPSSAAEVAATEAVQRTLPNLPSVSVEEGRRMLHAASLKEFQAAVAEGEAQLQTAQERVAQAETKLDEAERQAARDQYLRLQAAHTARLKSIALELDAQLKALDRLKGISPAPPTQKSAPSAPTKR